MAPKKQDKHWKHHAQFLSRKSNVDILRKQFNSETDSDPESFTYLYKMNKKQRNRKTVQQNRRNRIINKRYSTSTKSLTKLFLNKIKSISNVENNNYISEIKLQAKEILNKFYSMIDKAVKKGIVHKNTAARKKSRFDKIYKSI